MRRILIGIILILVTGFPAIVLGQTSGAGFPPFASVQSGGFDSVNLQNLNIGFGIPVVTHPGRGVDFRYNFFFNSLTWAPSTGASPQWTPPNGFGWGWQTDGPGGLLQYTEFPTGICPGESVQDWTDFIFTDPSGTSHKFGVNHWGLNGCGLQQNNTGYAQDASGYYIDISSTTNPVVRAPDGTKFVFTGGSINNTYVLQKPVITDPNGNQITPTTNTQTGEVDWTDTLGQTVLKITNQFNNPGGFISEADYGRLAVDGTYQTIALKYGLYSVKTNFGCSGITEYTSGTSGVLLVSEVDFPNGQNYVITYEPTPGNAGYVTARIQQVKLPTGGNITYQYTGPNDGVNCADGSVLGLTRTINDGTTSPMWTYSRTLNGSSGSTTTITAPKLPYDAVGNQTVVTFNSSGQEQSRKIYQGSATGTPARTINTTWTSGSTNITPLSRVLILEDGSTQSEVESTYDSNGNLQVLKEHDWGHGAPGPVLRTTNLSYLPTTGAYTGLNIINKVTTRTIADATGTVKSRTDIGYDGPGFINVNCITGAAQHNDASYGCSYTPRGLPTSVTTYAVAATQGGGITRNLSYDSLGNLITAQVTCCQQKQWNFSVATQYAYPDSIVSGTSGGPQLTESFTYYLTTGQLKTFVDENLKTTTYSYADAGHLDRLTDTLRPDQVHVPISYDDSQLTITDAAPVQGTAMVKRVVGFDGLGRPLHDTVEDANITVYSIIATQYDALGRPYMVSNPYLTTPQYWTTTQFDALGRKTTVSLPDNAQTVSTYATTAVTVTDPAGKQRRSIADGLGRMVEVDEPGDASAGAQASGSITINDPLNSKPTIPGNSGSGSVTISGTDTITVVCTRTCTSHWDTGVVSVTVTVAGTAITKNASFSQNVTAHNLASSLMTQFSADGNFKNVNVVDNSSTSSTLYLTASATGSATNYSYTASSTSVKDFTATAAGPNFTGGTDGQTGATDSGTITLSLGTFTTAPVSYGPSSNSNAAQVATALAQALGGTGSPVHNISVSGSTISMTANQLSSAWNVAVTATPTTNDPADFPNGSFASSGSLQGGADQYSSGIAHPYVTTYSYGVQDNLLTVIQGVQTRTYGFDDMGRLTSSSTPEAGQVTFQYNDFDLVTKRTDARGVVTNYGYDLLNRIQSISYDVGTSGVPATAGTTYTYGTTPAQNNNGRLTVINDGVGSETYTYDVLGRTSQLQKIVNGTTYQLGYAYNLAGQLTSVTYPSGTVVQQSFDAIGRLCEIAPQTTGCGTATSPYASGYTYNTASQTTAFNYGNGVSASFGYSPDRLQMNTLSYTKAAQTLFSLNYFYQQDPTNCSGGAAGNNGQIQCITDAVDSGRNLVYTYDTLGRIATAATKGSTNYPAWGLSFSVDRYGNRTAQNVTLGSGFPNQTPITTSTNRVNLPSFSYDASGNTTNDGNTAMAYDAGNRLISSTASGTVTNYAYDCKGLRVVKSTGSNSTVYIYSGSQIIAEYQNGALARQYIYAGNTLLAKLEGGATNYYHADRLSVRAITDNNGAITGQQGQYPYGEPWYDSLPANEWKFTNYQRDPESGNDYAFARFYQNRLGRFSSPDRMGGSTMAPQMLNRYNYVANDPINSTDPSGNSLYALDRFIYQTESFGFGWNEFDLLEFQIGEAFLFHSDDPTFDFESFSHDQLMSLSDAGGDGVIQLLGSWPIYETILIDPSSKSSSNPGVMAPLRPKDQKNFDKMKDRALRNLLYNQDCINFLLKNGLDPTTLALGLMNQTTASGDDSTLSMAAAGIQNNDPKNPNESVSHFFSSHPDVTAAAVPNGSTVFYENGNNFTSGQEIHETAHNVTGQNDSQLKTDFGIKQSDKSEEISKTINSHCDHDK